MKINFVKTIFLALVILSTAAPSWAQTNIQQVGYDTPDGSRITGFVYQSKQTAKDAPIALMMHGMTGSSLYWLAENNVTHGDAVTALLLARGYRIAALDARMHGARRGNHSPVDLMEAALAGDTEGYQDMILKTIDDYQFFLDQLLAKYEGSNQVLAVGYSMGAQMGTILAARDDRVTHLVTMVPPAARSVPELSPIKFAPQVAIPWLLLTATNDQFSTPAQNAELASSAAGKLTNVSFESGHMLPQNYVGAIDHWLANQSQ